MGPFGMGEIIVIAMLALVVLGPEKFPEFAKIAMRAFRDLRGYVDDIKREMAEEVKPIKEEMQKLSQYDPEEYIAPFTEAMAAVDEGLGDKEEEPGKVGGGDAAGVSTYREEVPGGGQEDQAAAPKPEASVEKKDVEYPD